MRTCLLIGLATLLAGCNTVNRGTTQTLTLQREPADAECTWQHPPDPARNVVTGNSFTVERTRYSVVVQCSKPGYVTARVVRPAMVSNVLPGGVFNLIDMSTGANNSYPPLTRVVLEPEAAAKP